MYSKYVDRLEISIEPCMFCRSGNVDIHLYIDEKTTDKKHQVICKNCGSRGPLLDNEISAVKFWNLRGGLPSEEKAKIIIENKDYSFDTCAKRFKERVPHIDDDEYREMANEVIIDHSQHLLDTAFPERAPHGTGQLVPGNKI